MNVVTKNLEIETIRWNEFFLRIGYWNWYICPKNDDPLNRSFLEQLKPEYWNPNKADKGGQYSLDLKLHKE